MRAHLRLLLVLGVALAAAGCAGEGATASNFDLTPDAIGWYAGDEASFTLRLEPSLTRSDPSFTIDRQFAIAEIRFDEQGLGIGGDYETRDPDDVALRLERDGEAAESVTLDKGDPELTMRMTLPAELRDSEYVLELQLFQVGWVKSEVFRVDRR